MARLVVRLLGGYRVELDGKPVYGFETDKARALLAYLIVEADRPHRRETLASLLWPDRPEPVARNSFRQALFRVRHALSDNQPPFFLFISPTDVQFNTASDYSLDVAELEARALPHLAPAAGKPLTQLLPETLCGDFLAGFSVADSETFQAWMLNRQEHCHRLMIDILGAQNAMFEGLGDYEQAVAASRLQLRLEPWLEEAHRRCMRGLALAGRRDEALHQYETCRHALEAELGVTPAPSTQVLYSSIREGRLIATGRSLRSARMDPGRGAVTPALPTAPQRPPPALVARQDELNWLEQFLAAALARETGVTFISGDPGSGKTALLEAFAGSAAAGRPDLLVAGARCSPRGHLDPLGPLRRLGEMLFGNLAGELAWRPAGPEAVDRLRRATDFLLASLRDHGPDLAGTLISSASVETRAHGPDSHVPPWYERESQPAIPRRALSQGEIFDQLATTLAAITRQHPLLLLLDDLQWVDAASAAFLLHIGRDLNDGRLLILCAYRSTAVSPGRRDPRSRRDGSPPAVGGDQRAAPGSGRYRGRPGPVQRPRVRRGIRRQGAQPPRRSVPGCALCTDGRPPALHGRDAAQSPGARRARQGRGGPLGCARGARLGRPSRPCRGGHRGTHRAPARDRAPYPIGCERAGRRLQR